MHILENINYKKVGTVLVLLIIAGSAIFFIHKRQQKKVFQFSTLARTSVAAVGATQSENTFVSVTGPLTSPDTLWDGKLIKPMPYAVIYRKAEVYSVGETKKEWRENSSIILVSTSTSINGYHLDLTRTHFSVLLPIKLSLDTIISQKDVALVDNMYLFQSANGKTTLDNPGIGDARVSYVGLPLNATTTAFGQIAGNSLIPYTFGNQTIYSLYAGTREDALKAMDAQ